MAVKMTSGISEVMDYRWQSPLQPGTPTSPHLEDFPWSVKKEKNMLSRSLGFVPSITLVSPVTKIIPLQVSGSMSYDVVS